MNNSRRARIREAVSYLEKAGDIVDAVLEEETDAMDNMPENLQSSDRFYTMENAVDNMTDAVSRIGDVAELLESAL